MSQKGVKDIYEIGDTDDDADDGDDDGDNDDDVEHTDGTHMYSIFSPRVTQHLVPPEINILMEPLDANLQSYDGNLQSYDQSTVRSPITGINRTYIRCFSLSLLFSSQFVFYNNSGKSIDSISFC